MIVSQGPILSIDVPKSIDTGHRETKTLEDIEREHVIQVLESCHWIIEGGSGAARTLGSLKKPDVSDSS